MYDKEPSAKLRLDEPLHLVTGLVGAVVINNKYMETFLQSQYGTDNLLDVLHLVVGRNNNYGITFLHGIHLLFAAKICNFFNFTKPKA